MFGHRISTSQKLSYVDDLSDEVEKKKDQTTLEIGPLSSLLLVAAWEII